MVVYEPESRTLAPGESDTMSPFIGNQHLLVVVGSTCYDFGLPLSAIPSGDYYKPGVRHTVFLVFTKDSVMAIKPYNSEDIADIVLEGTPCKSDS